MEGTHEFPKTLRPSHVTARKLNCTTGILRFLLFIGGQRTAMFQARYGNEDALRTFHCVVHDGPHPKPTICKGWAKLLDDKSLRVGDKVIFYVDVDQNNVPIRYRIQAFREEDVKVFGFSIGKTWSPIP